MNTLILVFGQKDNGKSKFCDALESQLELDRFDMPCILKEIVQDVLNLVPDELDYFKKDGYFLVCGNNGECKPKRYAFRKILQMLGKEGLERMGGNRYGLCMKMSERMMNSDKEVKLLDGCRYVDEETYFRSLASPNTRVVIVKIVRKKCKSLDAHSSEREVALVKADYLLELDEVLNIKTTMNKEAKKLIKWLNEVQ